jgi:large subunit ribosomal protein L25
MAIASIPLAAQTRTLKGSAHSHRLRLAGSVPAVIYGGAGPRQLQLDGVTIGRLLRKHTSKFLLFDLAIDNGAPVKALLKDVQADAMRGSLVHLDFQEISMDKRIRYSILVEPVGIPVGVSVDGGNLDVIMRSVVVESLPSDMIESIQFDVTAMKVGEHLNVSALPLDTTKFKMVTAPGITIVSLSAPKVEEEATPAAGAEAGAAGTPEVLKEKKPEEGAAPAAGAKDAKAAAPAKDAKKK